MASPLLLLRRVLLFSTLLVKPTIPSHIYASIHEVSQMKLKKINFTDVMVQVSMMAGRPLLDPIMAYLEVLMYGIICMGGLSEKAIRLHLGADF